MHLYHCYATSSLKYFKLTRTLIWNIDFEVNYFFHSQLYMKVPVSHFRNICVVIHKFTCASNFFLCVKSWVSVAVAIGIVKKTYRQNGTLQILHEIYCRNHKLKSQPNLISNLVDFWLSEQIKITKHDLKGIAIETSLEKHTKTAFKMLAFE